MNTAKSLVIIPARYASSRFPGKPLAMIKGKSMIQRVYEQCSHANNVLKVIVATDDERIFEHVCAFDGEVMMTKTTHQSGTDRCAEVATIHNNYDIVVNVQGDEPFIAPAQIDQVIDILLQNENANIATLVKKIDTQEAIFNPNIVKAVFACEAKGMNQKKKALYFSRNPIPYQRGVAEAEWLSNGEFYKHIGIYAFRNQTLLEVAESPQSPLEKSESLEQLRWLENGYTIGVDVTTLETVGIDTPEDLERLEN